MFYIIVTEALCLLIQLCLLVCQRQSYASPLKHDPQVIIWCLYYTSTIQFCFIYMCLRCLFLWSNK